MSDTTAPLSEMEIKQVRLTVKFAQKKQGEYPSEFRDRLLDVCMGQLRAPSSRMGVVQDSVNDAIDYFHRPTRNDFFREQSSLLDGKKRKKTESSGGPRVRSKDWDNRFVRLSDAPMSPARTPDKPWNPTDAPTTSLPKYTAYSGTLEYEFTTLVPPPSPTHTDYPTVAWNNTGLAPPTGDAKHVAKQKLDPDRLKFWQRQDRRGYPGQNSVMNSVSAESAASCALPGFEVFKAPETNYGNSAWEWLHLVSFKMGGIDNIPQQSDNLVAGTYECNSLMISLEEAIKDLVLIDGITLSVKVDATCYPGTHVGTAINYYVYYQKTTTEELVFESRFDPLVHINPSSGDKGTFLKGIKRHFGIL